MNVPRPRLSAGAERQTLLLVSGGCTSCTEYLLLKTMYFSSQSPNFFSLFKFEPSLEIVCGVNVDLEILGITSI